jgi:UDP-N-acetylglucosamine 2-epimerase (non-hydrolysing)
MRMTTQIADRPLAIMVVLGTRPEAIKLAPVILAARHRADTKVILCSTGQHRELVDTALAAFDLVPDIDLAIMAPDQSLTDVTTAVLDRLAKVFEVTTPDWVIVQGDTTTAFAGALAAFYRKFPVAHVEAGLRTGDIHSPWPEEINRRLISELASLHFAPTSVAAANLRREGISEKQIVVTGNTVIDALRVIESRLLHDAGFRATAEAVQRQAGITLDAEASPSMVLVTCHRRESFGAPLASICAALHALSLEFTSHTFVFPLHPNPHLRAAVDRYLRQDTPPNLKLIEALDYVSFVALMLRSKLLLTDSGGLQEEGVSLGKRVVVMREVTERGEGLATGLVRMAGTSACLIKAHASAALNGDWQIPDHYTNPYGDGTAGRRIVDLLHERRRVQK